MCSEQDLLAESEIVQFSACSGSVLVITFAAPEQIAFFFSEAQPLG